MKKIFSYTTFMAAAILFLIVASVALGSVNIPVKEVIKAITDPVDCDSTTVYIVRNIRLVRTAGAVLVGALLACCGLVFQTVFKNPMSDSFVLGISSCSSFCISLALVFGLSSTISLSGFSFIGSLLCVLMLFAVNRNNTTRLLLTGIAVNYLFASLSTLMMYIGRNQIDSIMFWTLGSLSGVKPLQLIVLLMASIGIFFFTYLNSEKMDLLLMSDSVSVSSGLDSQKWKLLLLAAASICTSITVSFCGIIGFIGLMSPHISRQIVGPEHKKLIPLSMLTGAFILLLSDLVSRTIAAPTEIPVGIITSIIGAPLFFVILRRKSV